MTEIDLDAARAARREANGEAPTLKLDGKVYPLAVELPAHLLDRIEELSALPDEMEKATPAEQAKLVSVLNDVAAAMLGPDGWAEVQPQLSVADLMEMLEQLAPAYGFESPGESSASPASS